MASVFPHYLAAHHFQHDQREVWHDTSGQTKTINVDLVQPDTNQLLPSLSLPIHSHVESRRDTSYFVHRRTSL